MQGAYEQMAVLRIGRGEKVLARDIVLILPQRDAGEEKSRILIADGQWRSSTVTTATLSDRLENKADFSR